MRIFYSAFAFIQLILAFLSRDQSRTAYLMYLLGWGSTQRTTPSKCQGIRTTHLDHKETKAEADSNEYSLLLER
jgi:hypothetical protein